MPASSLTRRLGLNVPCTHSCCSEKMVLLANENTKAASARMLQCGACADDHRHASATAMAATAMTRLSRDGMGAAAAASGIVASGVERVLRFAVPAGERFDHATCGQHLAAGELASRQAGAHAHDGAAADMRRADVDAEGAVGRERTGMAREPGARADHSAALDNEQWPIDDERARRPVDQRTGAPAPEEDPQRIEAGHEPEDLVKPGEAIEQH